MRVAFVPTIALILAGSLLAQSNPVPFVNQPLVPDALAPGGQDFTLTVNGTGFVNGATVNWNGTALATTFVNQGQVTATVPAGNIATAGTASVTATNPAPGGGTSSIQYFSVTNPAPSVTFAQVNSISDLKAVTLRSADFNSDGVLDLFVVFELTPTGQGGRCVLLGNGDGSFQQPTCVLQGWQSEDRWLIADFNGDQNSTSQAQEMTVSASMSFWGKETVHFRTVSAL